MDDYNGKTRIEWLQGLQIKPGGRFVAYPPVVGRLSCKESNMPVERYESFLNQDSISKNIMELADCRIRSFVLDLVRELMKATPATKEQNEIIQIILNVTERFGAGPKNQGEENVTQGRDRRFNESECSTKNQEGDFESASRNIFSPLYGKSPDEEKKD